jgi:clan AA aspartic protease
VIGTIDDHNRTLIDIQVRRSPNSAATPITTWIDTAFDGHLVCSRNLIDALNLETLADTEAILADGRKVTLEAFLCFVEWFGSRVPLHVIANDGKFPLLGTGLLEGRVLVADYSNKRLTLD